MFGLDWIDISAEVKAALPPVRRRGFATVLSMAIGLIAFVTEDPRWMMAAVLLMAGALFVLWRALGTLWLAIENSPMSDQTKRKKVMLLFMLGGPSGLEMLSGQPTKAEVEVLVQYRSRRPALFLLAIGLLLPGLTYLAIRMVGRYMPMALFISPLALGLGIIGLIDPETFWSHQMKKHGIAVSPIRYMIANAVIVVSLIIGAVLFYLMKHSTKIPGL